MSSHWLLETLAPSYSSCNLWAHPALVRVLSQTLTILVDLDRSIFWPRALSSLAKQSLPFTNPRIARGQRWYKSSHPSRDPSIPRQDLRARRACRHLIQSLKWENWGLGQEGSSRQAWTRIQVFCFLVDEAFYLPHCINSLTHSCTITAHSRYIDDLWCDWS